MLPTFTGLPPYPEFNDLVNKINTLVKELQNLMLNLDDVNFDRITANVIDVNELSAISANLGTITAGLLQAVTIVGSLIQTAETGTYPRIELSGTGNLLSAEKTSASKIVIDPDGTPNAAIQFTDGVQDANIVQGATTFIVGAIDTDLSVTVTNGDLFLTASAPYYVKVPSWSRFYSSGASQTLQSALDSKADKGITTSVETVDSLGNVNILNFTNGVLTSVT